MIYLFVRWFLLGHQFQEDAMREYKDQDPSFVKAQMVRKGKKFIIDLRGSFHIFSHWTRLVSPNTTQPSFFIF